MGHRPTTRSKNKRRRPDDDADTTPQILRKIHYSGEVTKDDFKHLYMIWKPVCQGCRVNTKDNPNCFCGLVPHPNGNRKSGLWQKQSEIIHSLGPDPCNDIRASHDSPAGLTNLGATCYANSILQCLYMNKSFREGVFSIEPDLLKQHPVLNQLARLFAQLHVSKMASVDSASFIETLKLDNAIQQDSHEFLTLLLSLLERCLRDSKVSKARTVVQDLFRGSVSHVTRCSKCGKDSAASSNIEDFYDLELNVKGLKSLDESLNDYLSLEELNGENQYFCDSCNTRVDATRYIKLRTLPDVLNFQLKRYIFLPKTAEKKKITSAFCFPGELAMGQRMHAPSQSELIYDLSAVLLHKGTAVNSGHYIAHIKDENTGQWWKFDDEDVSNFGCHPLGEASPISTAKSVQNESSAHLSCTEPRSTDVDGNNINASELQSLKSNSITNIETFSSCDAYMLRYNIRQRKTCDKTHTDCGGETMEIQDNVVSPNNDVACPSYLSEEIMELNASYIAACEEYKLKKERKLKHVTERRQEVRFILSEAPVLSQEDPYFWISTDWLREWADSISVGAIDNTSIQCLHGKVPVSKAGSMKRLSRKAWTLLHSKHGGGPILSNDDYCSSCLIDGANSIISADSYREKRTMMKELAEAALAGNIFDGTLYYVSRPWLQQWVRRKNIDSPCEADAGPTGSIRCIHGDLLPERAVGARNQHHVLVPENLWLFFYERANAVKPDDSRGCWAFPSDSRPCAQCSVEYQEAASLEVTLRMVKLKQRQNHEKLAQGKGIALSSNCGYYLLPSLWLSNWRSYVNATGKNASLSVEPDPLDIVINSLKCEEHSLLLERPLDLTYKRGSIFQRGSTTDGLTIITESDWKLFCKEWGGTEENGIYAEIEFTNGLTNNLVCSCDEFPILDGHLSPDGTTDGNESKQLVIKTTPEICEDCIGEKERCELKRKQNYCNECIRVCFVRGKNAPKSVIEASGTSDLDRRTSKRSRKTNFGNSVNLEVSGSTTIYQLKLMIWESFGVIKENQVLCKGSGPITGEEAATLADMNIFPGDTLWVTDSEIHEHRDIAEELLNHNVDVQHSGEGFQGTLLTSNASSVVA